MYRSKIRPRSRQPGFSLPHEVKLSAQTLSHTRVLCYDGPIGFMEIQPYCKSRYIYTSYVSPPLQLGMDRRCQLGQWGAKSVPWRYKGWFLVWPILGTNAMDKPLPSLPCLSYGFWVWYLLLWWHPVNMKWGKKKGTVPGSVLTELMNQSQQPFSSRSRVDGNVSCL